MNFSKKSAAQRPRGPEPLTYHLTDKEAAFIGRIRSIETVVRPDDVQQLDHIEGDVIDVARRLRRPVAARHNGVEFFRVSADGTVEL